METEARSSHNLPDVTQVETHIEDKLNAASELNDSTTLLALMPSPKIERLIFSTRPEMLLEQAQRIEVWPLPEGEHTSIDASSTRSSHLLSSHLLMFARDMRESETVVGCELVAYPCDLNGRVVSWTHRFACCALNFPLASQKLRLQIVNDMATLHHIENLC